MAYTEPDCLGAGTEADHRRENAAVGQGDRIMFSKATSFAPPSGEIILATTASELFAAVGRVRPGGTILLADGHYRLPRVVRLAEKRHTLLDAKASNLV